MLDYFSFHRSYLGKVLRRIYRYTSDKKFLESISAANFGYRIDWDNPKTFNEKMSWIKLYDHNPLYHKMVDKYEAKFIVKNKIGDGYTAKCYGVWDDFDNIDFEKIPVKAFVVKSTHYGTPIIVKDVVNMDKSKMRKILKKQAKTSGYKQGKEWSYKDVKPRIIIEEYLQDDSDNNMLQDYKFWCFNGQPKAMYFTVKDKIVYENFYDMNFNVIDINHGFPRHQPEFEKPNNFDEMKEIATKLSEGIPFVRIDLYNIKGKIYFGEFTFYDWGGTHAFATYEQDLEIGSWLKLPEKNI